MRPMTTPQARTAAAAAAGGRPLRIRTPNSTALNPTTEPIDRSMPPVRMSTPTPMVMTPKNACWLSTAGLVSRRAEADLGTRWVNRLRVKTPSLAQPVGLLSGGNQQKVVFGKWLARGPKVLILDEPTRGVDVGSKAEIYALMDQLAGAGVAILMISSDLEEVLGMSDRVLVLHEGRLAGELGRAGLSEAAVMHLATGGGRGAG